MKSNSEIKPSCQATGVTIVYLVVITGLALAFNHDSFFQMFSIMAELAGGAAVWFLVYFTMKTDKSEDWRQRSDTKDTKR